MYAGKTRDLPYIRNYRDADEWFTKTNPVKARKHPTRWPGNARPLKTSGFPHYRLLKGDGLYDVVLYNTVMARFYAPTTNERGQEVETRYYVSHASQTSKGFMWDVLGIGVVNRMTDTTGVERMVPIGYGGLYDPCEGGSPQFGARLVFIDGKLSVPDSDHQTMYQRKASDADKIVQRRTRERLAPLMDLLALQMPTFEQNCDIDYYRGKAFGGRRGMGTNRDMREALRRLLDLSIPIEQAITQTTIEGLYAYGQECFNVLASKRSVAMGSKSSAYWTLTRPATDDPHALDRPITAKDLQTSVTNALFKDFWVAPKSARVTLPKFLPAEDFPKSNRYFA